MKKIIYIATFLLTLFPLITDGGMVSAQSMAYEGGSLWELAGETGEYHIKRCDYCPVLISGTSDSELKINMKNHMFDRHPDEFDNRNKDENDEGNENGTSEDNPFGNNGHMNDNGYYDKLYVIDLSFAAMQMSNMGLGNYSQIISDYKTYYNQYITGSTILVTNFCSFIMQMYKPRAVHHNIKNYISTNKFIGLYVPDESGQFVYYRINTNRQNSYNTFYEYVFEFE